MLWSPCATPNAPPTASKIAIPLLSVVNASAAPAAVTMTVTASKPARRNLAPSAPLDLIQNVDLWHRDLDPTSFVVACDANSFAVETDGSADTEPKDGRSFNNAIDVASCAFVCVNGSRDEKRRDQNPHGYVGEPPPRDVPGCQQVPVAGCSEARQGFLSRLVQFHFGRSGSPFDRAASSTELPKPRRYAEEGGSDGKQRSEHGQKACVFRYPRHVFEYEWTIGLRPSSNRSSRRTNRLPDGTVACLRWTWATRFGASRGRRTLEACGEESPLNYGQGFMKPQP